MQKEIEFYFDKLWPICRSITGNGLRNSLKILSEIIPVNNIEVPSGAKVFDWAVPDEWNIEEATLIGPDGIIIADFKVNNLHILNYSIPVEEEMTYEALLPHLFYIEDMPDAIPYLTSYYKKNWGFCISYNQFKNLPKNGLYKVNIKSTLKPGSLTYGEYLLKGNSDKEILISTYLCHPSMANNELSGPLVSAFLYKKLKELPERKYSYRFLFAPETIGVIAFLHERGKHLMEKLIAGYVVTCIGDPGNFTYKNSKNENDLVNRAARHVLKMSGKTYSEIPFAIGGSDERQYCSPGFNLPVGSLMRTPYQRFKEYHTSLDNKSFISFDALAESVEFYFEICRTLEINMNYVNLIPFCEPQLGKRGLYTNLGGQKSRTNDLSRRLHLLSFADGNNDLITIAEKLNVPATEFIPTIIELKEAGLLT